MKKHKNIIKISLEVAVTNTTAISFYLSMGFYKTGLRKNYYLIRKGVAKQRLSTKSFGESQRTSGTHDQNRRVEFEVIE